MASGVDPAPNAGLDRAGRVFAALADPTRRDIVRELSIDGPLTATELATRAGISRQAAAIPPTIASATSSLVRARPMMGWTWTT